MSRWHNCYLDSHAHFCTYTVLDWHNLLTNSARAVLYEVWNDARQALDVAVLAYVIMPNHVHMMLSTTSRRLNSGEGQFWKERPRILPVYSCSALKIKIEYIHRNPVRKGLVLTSGEWIDSSFRQICGGCSDVPFLCDPLTDFFVPQR